MDSTTRREIFNAFIDGIAARDAEAPLPAWGEVLLPGSPGLADFQRGLSDAAPDEDILAVRLRHPGRRGEIAACLLSAPLFWGLAFLCWRRETVSAGDWPLSLFAVVFALGGMWLIAAAVRRWRAEYYLVFTPTELRLHRGIRWRIPFLTLPRDDMRRVELHELISTSKGKLVERRGAIRVTLPDRTQKSLSLFTTRLLQVDDWAWLGRLAAAWAGVELFNEKANAVLLHAAAPVTTEAPALDEAPPARIILYPPDSAEARALADSFAERKRSFAADRVAIGLVREPSAPATGPSMIKLVIAAVVAVGAILGPLAAMAWYVARVFTIGWGELAGAAVCLLVLLFGGLVGIIAGAIFVNGWCARFWRLTLVLDADCLWIRRSVPGWRREDRIPREAIADVEYKETGTTSVNGNRVHTDWGVTLNRHDAPPLTLLPAEPDEQTVAWLRALLARWAEHGQPER